MIRITYLSSGKLMTGTLADLPKLKSEVWIDCVDPSKPELKQLSDSTGIPNDDFQRALDEDERPSLSEFDTFTRITLHAPLHMKKDGYITVPFSLFLKQNLIIIVRSKHIDAIERFEMLAEEKKLEILKKDTTYTLYTLINEIVTDFFTIVDELEVRIEFIDSSVFKSRDEKFVKEIFGLKKTLIFFHKSLKGCRDVVQAIEKQFVKEITGKNTKKFRYLYNDFGQLIDMVDTYRDILTSSLDVHLTAASNNLNEVMKKLTLITTVLLVPSLVAGIYGMNFKYMPEIHALDRWGYPLALAMMAVLIASVIWYFKKKEWV